MIGTEVLRCRESRKPKITRRRRFVNKKKCKGEERLVEAMINFQPNLVEDCGGLS